MKYTDKITIAIPVFERIDFFHNTLQNVLNQTVKCPIIVVDNGSSHNYFEKICKEKGIRYYRNEQNIGMFPNWNRCFEYAITEFVFILGDDDILMNDYVERFLFALERYPSIDLYFSDFMMFNYENGSCKHHHHVLPFGYMPNGNRIIEYGIMYRLGFPLISSTIRKSKFTGYYELFHASNDWVWLYGQVVDFEIYGDEKRLLHYGIHSKNDSRSENTNLRCSLSIWYIYEVLLKKNSLISRRLRYRLRQNICFVRFYFLSRLNNDLFFEIREANDRYSCFFNSKMDNCLIIRCYLKLPLCLRKFIFKVIKKTSIVR